MAPSDVQDPPPLDAQADYWDRWNAHARETRLTPSSLRQAAVVEAAAAALGRRDLRTIDVGCGTGWMCERLAAYGRVTGTDMTETVLERARHRVPGVEFVCGDFFALPFPKRSYDLAVALEVLSHVADQSAFVARLAALLKPGGTLVLATQNRPVFERWEAVAPPNPAQIRHWVDHRELRALLAPHFAGVRVTSVCPAGSRGFLRLVNSVKLNRLAGAVVGGARLERFKERLLLGQTLIAIARAR
jgi:2-polyprenyl-3-methyl-5-hydroxy-6-metoxy-1,4-benzoquinol methylase